MRCVYLNTWRWNTNKNVVLYIQHCTNHIHSISDRYLYVYRSFEYTYLKAFLSLARLPMQLLGLDEMCIFKNSHHLSPPENNSARTAPSVCIRALQTLWNKRLTANSMIRKFSTNLSKSSNCVNSWHSLVCLRLKFSNDIPMKRRFSWKCSVEYLLFSWRVA